MNRLWHKAIGLFQAFWRELAKFGVVGGGAFIVDSVIFLSLITGPMEDSHVKSRLIAGGVATLFSWVGNRYWTFRHQRTKTRVRELVMFIIMNLIGMGIQAACVFVSFYGLGLTSATASFVSGNIIGLGFAMCFRFVAYKLWVFTGEGDSAAVEASQQGAVEDRR
ncbi:MAG: GtrA family protein [Nesterenkonia sp.]